MVNKKRSKMAKLALGASLIILGLLFLYIKPESLVKSTSFESEPVKIENLSNEEFDESDLPKRIVIPKLSMDMEVKRSKIINGYWEVFKDTAGWGVGSGIPGKIGNQIIFAHAQEGLFLPLRSIEVGYIIYILTESEWYKYEVREIKEVYPNQTEVIAPTGDETLTLYTCSGFADSKRLIVIAKRI